MRDKDIGQQVFVDLKSKQCPVGEFSTSYPCRRAGSQPPQPCTKETSSQSFRLRRGPEKAVASGGYSRGERGWKVPVETKGFACQSGPPWLQEVRVLS